MGKMKKNNKQDEEQLFKSFRNFQDIEGLTECFFKWLEYYHKLEAVYDSGVSDLMKAKCTHKFGSYQEFKDISKQRLMIMIDEMSKKRRNKK